MLNTNTYVYKESFNIHVKVSYKLSHELLNIVSCIILFTFKLTFYCLSVWHLFVCFFFTEREFLFELSFVKFLILFFLFDSSVTWKSVMRNVWRKENNKKNRKYSVINLFVTNTNSTQIIPRSLILSLCLL